MVEKQYYVYLLTNKWNTVLYTGVTNDLKRRIYEHKEKLADGFSKKYHLNSLVYYETTESIESAIMREKQIKSWSRKKKDALVRSMNPDLRDLYDNI